MRHPNLPPAFVSHQPLARSPKGCTTAMVVVMVVVVVDGGDGGGSDSTGVGEND